MASPLFIVFEGIDGCGKSTQLKMLCEKLTSLGRKPLPTAEPTDTATGKMLRAALSGSDKRTAAEMAALFTLDRIHHNKGEGGIDECLERGFDVISDRYYYSSLAYQGSLTDYEWVRQMNVECPEIRRPDLCIFLDISPAAALERIGKRGEAKEIYEKQETLTLFRETFMKVFASLPDRVAVINAEGAPEEVAARVMDAVAPLLNTHQGGTK
ncbi:MAG: dTMP kinase [Clostridia bacterium]|nr:dTMP kinase [Clostridia bacterium]